MAKHGLGKGIGALIGDTEQDIQPNIAENISDADEDKTVLRQPDELPIILIDNNPSQPRQSFDEIELQSLAESLKTYGMIQPLVVRPTSNGRYMIISGERRWRAAKLAKLSSVPVIIRDVSDNVLLEMALVENIQRVDLNPLEQAFTMQTLMQEFGLTQVQLSERLSKSRTAISNTMRLLNLSIPVQKMLRTGELNEGQARPLIGLPEEKQLELARQIKDRGLSARASEELASREKLPKEQKEKTEKTSTSSSDLKLLEELFRDTLGCKVKAQGTASRGTITISCFSRDDIVRVYDLVKELSDFKKLNS